MSEDIATFYQQSELALAAYSQLSSGITGDSFVSALREAGMSQSQAQRFAATWSVVDQYTAPWSGFSATLFEKDGQRYLAIRGTQISDPRDWLADLDLAAVNGVAAMQTVDLYNYVQRLMGAKGQAVEQLEWNGTNYVLNPAGAVGLLDAPLSGPITVAGHSLGGHLAMAFGRLFPQNTAQIYTYNAPGFLDGSANNLFAQLDAALGRAGSGYQDGKTTNLYGSGLNLIAGYADDHGTPQEVFLESNTHSIVALTDALAVYNLYTRADGSLAAGTIAAILAASSDTGGNTLEAATGNLAKVFLTDPSPIASGDRNALYEAIFAVQQELGGSYTIRRVGLDAAADAAAAAPDIAVRYALYALLPITVQGYSYESKAELLSLYDPASGQGNLSEAWLQDRAAMLAWKVKLATEDFAITDGAYTEGPDGYFSDLGSGYRINLGSNWTNPTDKPRYVFGTEQDDAVSGGSQSDRLYGGMGNDVLYGYDGPDYLEGGAGYDTYNAGEGDMILDSDGQGEVWLIGQRLSYAVRERGESYYVDDEGNQYAWVGGRLAVNDSILIEDFENKELGIYLDEESEEDDGDGRRGPAGDYDPAAAVPRMLDPLVLDLNGNGQIDLVPLSNSGVYFDLNGDGLPERTGWVQPGDGLLALDRNGNGTIDDISEVFGGATGDGFSDLSQYDTHLVWSWRIDALDTVYDNLRIWRDLNQDGVSQAGELSSLQDEGITSISLQSRSVWREVDGNMIASESTFVRNGTEALIADIYLDTDPLDTNGNPYREVDTDFFESADPSVFRLPWLRGSGMVRDAHYAYDLDPLLRGSAFALSEMGLMDQWNSFDRFLSRWSGLEERHAAFGITKTENYDGYDKAWMLDAFYGITEYWHPECEHHWAGLNAVGVNDVYISDRFGALKAHFFGRLLAQEKLDGVWFSLEQDRLILRDAAAMRTSLVEILSEASNHNEALVALLVCATLTESGIAFDGPELRDQLASSPYAEIYLNILPYFEQASDNYSFNIEGNRSILTYGVNMITIGGGQDDYIAGGVGINIIYGGDGNDSLWGNVDDDRLYGGDGNDALIGDGGDDYLSGGAGDDDLEAMEGDDEIYGGGGDDNVYAGSGDDLVHGDAGSDQLFGDEGNDIIYGGTGSDNLDGAAGNDILYGDEGDDTLFGGDGDNMLDGGSGNDYLLGGSGADTLTGGEGNDTLGGGAGTDILDGGTGIDYLNGGDGADTYLFTRGFGQDTIYEYDEGSGGNDILRFAADILPAEIELSRNDYDLFLKLVGTDDRITVSDFYADPAQRIERVEFADGTVWTTSTLLAAKFVGTEGADSIFGTTGNDHIEGRGGDDWLFGDAGADTLDGGFGNDQLYGEAGNDIYLFDRGYGQDTINETSGTDTVRFAAGITAADVFVWRDDVNYYFDLVGTNDRLTVDNWYSGSTYRIERVEFADGTVWNSTILNGKTTTASEYADFYWGTAGANTYDGLAGDDRIFGFGGNDTLRGGAGNDFIDGGIGSDIMIGGTGDDTYVVDSASDTVTELAGEGVDTVQATVSHTLADNVENLTLLEAGGAINGSGNALDNILIGNASANILTGGAGNDWIEGGAGNDTLDGGIGADVMIGGAGNDTYVVDDAGDVVIELAGQGTDTVQSSISYVLGSNLEKLTLTGTAAIDGIGNELDNTLTGNAAANTLIGGAGNDSLNGGAGADILIGGTGDDTYTVDNAGDVVIELEGEGNDTVRSSIDWTLGATLENLTLTGSANRVGTGNALDNVLTGNSGSNTLYGLAGNDVLDGGAGTDTLIGGTGDDTYVVDNAGDVVTENAGEGTDTVLTSVTHTLAANVENLILLEAGGAINGTGNALDNVITGNSANNILNGGAGADTLVGGLGDDIYVVDALDTVVENAGEGIDTVQAGFTYTLGANLEKLTLTGSSAVNGYGNELDNTLTGNSAANVLAGGLGNDTYVIGATDTVIEYAGEGIDTVQASFSYTLTANVENLTLTGSTAINATGNVLDNTLTGNSGANVLTGLAGNDWLDGKAGADTMIGGTGDDTYVVDNAGDVVTELADEGIDTVRSSLTYTLGANIENLLLTGSGAVNGTGNELDNVLTGNSGINILTGGAGNDTLDGKGGADTMIGGTGDDIYTIDNVGDVVTENAGEGSDTVISSIAWTLGANLENLTLSGSSAIAGTGNAADNIIVGNAAANVLWGRAGNDTLRGYGGADTLNGEEGDDFLDGGSGNDTLVGGAGNDTYWLARGYGNDTIQENDATAGNTDLARFDTGIAVDQLWFRHVGNNLEVSIIGTADKFTIQNWYSGSAYRVEQFRTADDRLLLDSQVENLVQAMAAFSPPASGQTTLPQNYQDALNPVIAANWQ